MTDRYYSIDVAAAHYSASALARFFNVPIGTIHRWAHEDDWQRMRLHGATVYAMTDAQQSYDQRGRARRDTLRRRGA